MNQKEDIYCLCSVISDILLDRKERFISKENIAKNLTPGKYGFRADDDKIKFFMNNHGFDYNFYWWNETPLGDPSLLLEDISNNEGFVGIGNHVYRVLKFEEPTLSVKDPADKSLNRFNYYELMKDLSIEDGGFGLIKKLK